MEAALLYSGGAVVQLRASIDPSGCKNLSRWGSQVSQFFETVLS